MHQRILQSFGFTTALVIVFFVNVTPSMAAKIQPSPARDKADQSFIQVCQRIFDAKDSGDFGERLCKCTAKEARSQEVALETLKKETGRIQASSAYKIEDKGLLAAFQVCAGDLTHEALDPHDD